MDPRLSFYNPSVIGHTTKYCVVYFILFLNDRYSSFKQYVASKFLNGNKVKCLNKYQITILLLLQFSLYV